MLRKIFQKKSIKVLAALLLTAPILLLGICYGLLRSDRFIQSYLLPKLSDLTGHRISASSTSIKLFSELTLEGLRVNCDSADGNCASSQPLSVSAKSFNAKYNIWALLTGTLDVTSLTGDTIRVNLVNQPNKPSEAKQQASSEDSASPNQAGTVTNTPTEAQPGPRKKPSFAIQLAQVAIKNSSFHYADPKSNSAYQLNSISIDIPTADSNGDSELRLQTSVSATSPSLSLKDQRLSGTITLRDAAMFAPKAVEIAAKAGSAQPTPLELQGSLDFADSPYALEFIKVSKAIIRNTLLTTLQISPGPISDFEYEIKGGYPLTTATPFNVALLINRAITPSSTDLKGSKVSSTLLLRDGAITVEKSSVELLAQAAPIAKSSVSGTFAFDPYSKPTKATVHISDINFDSIEALFKPVAVVESNSAQGEANSGAATKEPKAAPDTTTTPAVSPAAPMRLPLVDANLKIDRAVYQKLGISNVAAEINIPSNRVITRAALNATFDGAGSLSTNISGSLDSSLNVKANAQKVNVLPLAALAQGDGALLEGVIDLLDLNLSISPADPRSTITGRSQLQISRFIVPSTLHGQIPFNILFLPFDALITVFGGTINAILPKSVSSISAGIREVLDDAGRLGIEKGTVDLDFNQGKISCNKVEIDTKNLPDFTIKGSVSAKDKLDFTIFIALLKLNLPLPVAGTLSTPLPDVVYLGPEIVRGLGLSIGNIAGGVASLVGGSKSDNTSPAASVQQPTK
jgi:hypothetical protein